MVVKVDEEGQAGADVWKHIFCHFKGTVILSAVELEIPDILENHGGPISLSDLSAAVGCPPEPLHRVMRFLIHYGIFKNAPPPSDHDHDTSSSLPPSDHDHDTSSSLPPSGFYSQTPLSRRLTRDNLGPLMLMQGTPRTRGPLGVTAEGLRAGKKRIQESDQGEDLWTDPAFGLHFKAFTDGMEAHAKVTTAAIIGNYPEAFGGVGTLVDVGGRHGLALGLLVKAFPWVKGTCYDLPEVVAEAPPRDGVDFVGGSMFESVPKAEGVMLMRVLHDWSDEACIDILKKCKEAVPKDSGKVIIVDAIIDEDGDGDEYAEARLLLDMVMMAVMVDGKERTLAEWTHILKQAGFSRHTVKNIKAVEFVIEAYP